MHTGDVGSEHVLPVERLEAVVALEGPLPTVYDQVAFESCIGLVGPLTDGTVELAL